ncbi:RNA-directed DNA polymerase, eukaryota [Tanacetum coccineum]
MNSTVLDYFVITRGYWQMTGKKIMIIAIYAPQESKEKKSLWDFLHHEIGKWNGDVIIMGDFNEVRCKSDRFGSQYNHHGAQRFNSFILNAGLVEVNLGGCHFTWCHKSASKMSKLDRFLVSESVLSSCPNINAISLDRFLSDHRPILLKDNRYDYGPTPFRFFHHWLEMDGFQKFMENIWKSNKMGCRRKEQHQLKKDLGKMESDIDSGRGNDELVKKRLETINQIQNLDRLEALETAQKWIDEPDKVKKEFLDHFANRFCKPAKSTASIDVDFPNQLDSDQRSFLERDVTNAEIKKAVWECGTDKAPGPDGFSFRFFRHFWYLVDVDVYAAVSLVLEKSGGNGFIVVSTHLKGPSLLMANGVKAISSLLSTSLIVFIWVSSGLKINLNKSKLMGIQVDSAKVSRAAGKFGCLVLKTPFLYLGSYVGGNMHRLQSWDDIINRVRSRLSKWKMQMLSIGGRLTRVPRGGAESSQVEELKRLIQPATLKQGKDSWNWSLSKSGTYSVASVRKLIDSSLLPSSDMKTRWIRYIPNKVNVFAWKVMTNSLPTRFNISRRGIDIESISCVNCVFGVETTNHLFFTCDMAKQVSNLIARWWDISYMDIDSYDDWRNWIDNIRLPCKNKLMLEGIFFVMWWLLWNFRNKKIFEDKAPDKAMFFDDVICKSYYWCRYRSKKVFSWVDWFKNPHLISLMKRLYGRVDGELAIDEWSQCGGESMATSNETSRWIQLGSSLPYPIL